MGGGRPPVYAGVRRWGSTLIFCLTESDREQIDACIRDLLAEKVK
jgi:hypothetical protein